MFVLRIKIGIGFTIAFFFPHMENAAQISCIFAGNVDSFVYGKSSYFLSFPITLQSGFFLIEGKALFGYNVLNLLSEFTPLLIDIMHTRECHIIGISSIVYSELFG